MHEFGPSRNRTNIVMPSPPNVMYEYLTFSSSHAEYLTIIHVFHKIGLVCMHFTYVFVEVSGRRPVLQFFGVSCYLLLQLDLFWWFGGAELEIRQ